MVFEPDARYRVRVRLPRIISAETRSLPRDATPRGDEKTRRGRRWGRSGAFWAFFRVFSRSGTKSRKPPLPGIEPTTAPVFWRGVTKIPGPWLCCRGTGPEPQLSPPGALLHQPYPRPRESGAYPRKKAGSAGIGLRPGPQLGEVQCRTCYSARATGIIPGTSTGLQARILPYSYLILPCIS